MYSYRYMILPDKIKQTLKHEESMECALQVLLNESAVHEFFQQKKEHQLTTVATYTQTRTDTLKKILINLIILKLNKKNSYRADRTNLQTNK